MPLVALHAASLEQCTGVIVIRGGASWRLRVELVRGWIHGFGIEPSVDLEPPARLGERRQRDAALAASVAPTAPLHPPATRLAHLLVIAVRAGFLPESVHEPRLPHVATTPFQPLAMLRAALDTLLSTATIDTARGPFVLTGALHASGLDPDEQAAAALLTSARDWDELLRRSRCPPPRLARLLRDAAALGVLRGADADLAASLSRLMTEAPATRAAYHARARALHPDLHPELSAEEKKRLSDEMAELAARNRR